jgi:hypothetical protein
MIWQRIRETLDFMERNTCFAFIGSAFFRVEKLGCTEKQAEVLVPIPSF